MQKHYSYAIAIGSFIGVMSGLFFQLALERRKVSKRLTRHENFLREMAEFKKKYHGHDIDEATQRKAQAEMLDMLNRYEM